MYPKLHHADRPNSGSVGPLDGGWAKRWQNQGFQVIGWGWLEGDPLVEAQLAVDMCKRYDLDGYIANAEVHYEGWNKGKSKAFVTEFRRLAPRAPLALSGLGYGYPVRDFDYQPWKDTGAVFMPQAYPNHDGISLEACIGHADRAGWDRSMVVPTLGTWQGNYGYSIPQYIRELRDAGTLGFNVFLGETMNDDGFRALGDAIRDYGLAL